MVRVIVSYCINELKREAIVIFAFGAVRVFFRSYFTVYKLILDAVVYVDCLYISPLLLFPLASHLDIHLIIIFRSRSYMRVYFMHMNVYGNKYTFLFHDTMH